MKLDRLLSDLSRLRTALEKEKAADQPHDGMLSHYRAEISRTKAAVRRNRVNKIKWLEEALVTARQELADWDEEE